VLPRIPIARDGLPFILVPALAAAPSLLLSGWLALFLLGLALFMAFFFRDPERPTPGADDVLVAPADGRVVRLVEEGGRRTLSIFLSVFDVHVNRSPATGLVERLQYHPGRFQAAFRHGASTDNERNAVTLRTTLGTVTAVQIAGLLARRIVCRLKEGDYVRAGDRIGMIKFGSRMDVTVPASVDWTVGLGTHVRAGVTVIGRPAAGVAAPADPATEPSSGAGWHPAAGKEAP
jgi:phosphatidylserine decarboxylase